MESNTIYKVEKVTTETEDVKTLTLVCDVTMKSFRAGQFITVFFPETGHAEGKSYSISKTLSPNSFEITVKAVGTFSNKLCSLKAGDEISASFPYGYFYSESETSSLVLIAGGIGIAPFRAMISSLYNRKIILFYSNKKVSDIIFKKEFDDLVKNKKIEVNYYITQEDAPEDMRSGRIQVSDIILSSKVLVEPEFFICGSIAFVRDFWRGLKEGGIDEGLIYTEAFF